MKPKIVFKIQGFTPDPVKEAQKAALQKQIEDMEALLGTATAPQSGRHIPKPARRTAKRRIIEGPSVPFKEWAHLILNLCKDNYIVERSVDSGRVDIMPKDENEKWRLTTLAYIGAEFCSTLFYGWGGNEKMNIKKHTIEFYKKEKMVDVVTHLLANINKF